ncbi:hypothetical protein WKI71_00105 [Streptomyces sp. MS1.AVA.1]|uniref:Uncharacterized protein n=1 Tax=Streptomyces machairae TaxID=3134109 RepID=A0ABU8UH95_9ACTN
MGIIVDSLRATLEVAIEAGGELVPTQSSPEFALLADPGGHPLLLWEKPRSTPIRDVLAARVDFVTGGIDHLAAFYHRVAGWETQVLPQDGSTVAVLTHHDRAVGILREGPEEQTLAHLISHPGEVVWPAHRAPGLEVDNLKIWPLLGRQWRIRDRGDNALVVAERAPAARPTIQLTPWARLPDPLATAFQDLDSALGFSDMAQRQLNELPRTPPLRTHADALLTVLNDVLIPAAEACRKANEDHRTLGPDREALAYMRQTVTNVLNPFALTVERLDDMDLSRVFRFACRLLARAQLLPENIDERLGGHVSV